MIFCVVCYDISNVTAMQRKSTDSNRVCRKLCYFTLADDERFYDVLKVFLYFPLYCFNVLKKFLQLCLHLCV